MELSRSQDLDNNIEYYVGIPWKLVKQAVKYKLFGNKKDSGNKVEEDEVIEVDPTKKVKYLNIKLHGNTLIILKYP